ncbi:MAG: ABC transporter permease [Actinobacteria bacterium]|nr:ABC transporter permease [Actinomycetota bacterium]
MRSAGLGVQVASLARRSIVRTLRQPASAIPPIVFPLALMALNSGGLHAATDIPGFPTDNFYAFALAVPFVQGALFSTVNAGTDLARDIQTGFFNRLSLTPMRGAALLAGNLAGNVVLGVAQAAIYITVGLLIGVDFESGPGGIAVLLVLAALISLGFGALGAMLALRTGSGEAVQGLFPVLFVFLFISSMNMPRNLIEIDWFRIAASFNPVSYLLEGVRSLVIEGWDAETLALGFGMAVGVTIAATIAASLALRSRLERT